MPNINPGQRQRGKGKPNEYVILKLLFHRRLNCRGENGLRLFYGELGDGKLFPPYDPDDKMPEVHRVINLEYTKPLEVIGLHSMVWRKMTMIL